MPTIQTVKISQEVNFMGMATWIGLEGTLLPEENEKDGLRALQKSITEYLQEEEKAYKGKWKKPDNPVIEQTLNEEFDSIKESVISAETKEDAMEIINNSGNWKIPLEFQTREIVKSKPSK
jgi:hypothetical protein